MNSRTSEESETATLTKVVIQFLQFQSDKRARDTLIEQSNVIEDEDIELTDAS